MSAYYNEHDKNAAAWLRELIKRNLIADGEVDERSISDVAPADLVGFTQHHFFAGIGVWSHALRSAGWPDDRPVWTGSCPCQPFSAAGKGDGFADERHLWPHWFHLVRTLRPAVVFGEQVTAALNHGWLDLVQSDLEGEGFRFAAVGFPAASVGAPHIRSRLYWVAHAAGDRADGRPGIEGGSRDALGAESGGSGIMGRPTSGGRGIGGDAPQPGSGRHADGAERPRIAPWCAENSVCHNPNACDGNNCWLAKHGKIAPPGWTFDDDIGWNWRDPGADGAGVMGDTDHAGPQGRRLLGATGRGDGADQRAAGAAGATNSFWSDAVWIPCRDGKSRPTGRGIHPLVVADAKLLGRELQPLHRPAAEQQDLHGAGEQRVEPGPLRPTSDRQGPTQSGSLPLAHGPAGSVVRGSDCGASVDPNATSEARVMRLKGYGNAIVAPAAQAFIEAYLGL